jgi:hypothetical protein
MLPSSPSKNTRAERIRPTRTINEQSLIERDCDMHREHTLTVRGVHTDCVQPRNADAVPCTTHSRSARDFSRTLSCFNASSVSDCGLTRIGATVSAVGWTAAQGCAEPECVHRADGRPSAQLLHLDPADGPARTCGAAEQCAFLEVSEGAVTKGKGIGLTGLEGCCCAGKRHLHSRHSVRP